MSLGTVVATLINLKKSWIVIALSLMFARVAGMTDVYKTGLAGPEVSFSVGAYS